MKMKLSLLAASAILAVGMTGCWTESAPTPPAVPVTGVAIDGYVANARVCIDTNNNESTCENELAGFFTRTMGDGSYTIPLGFESGKIIITEGTDLDTNSTFTGVLKAPAGSKVASPLTTLLADGMTMPQINAILGGTSFTEEELKTINFRDTATFNAGLTKAAMQIQAVIGQLTVIFSQDKTLSQADIMKSIVVAMTPNTATGVVGFTKLEELTDTTKLLDLIKAVDAKLSSSVKTDTLTITSSIITNVVSTVNAIPATIDKGNVVTAAQEVAQKIVDNSANTIVETPTLIKSVTIKDNTFTVSGNAVTFGQNGTFTAPASASASNTVIGFTLENNGGELTNDTKNIDVAIFIKDKNSGRELKAVLIGATITSSNGITVPTTAKLYIEGKNSAGTATTGTTLDNNGDDFKTVDGATTFNLTNVMNRLKVKVTSLTDYANIMEVGSYTISFYVSGLTLGFDGTEAITSLVAPKETITVDGHSVVEGTKFTGTLTVTN